VKAVRLSALATAMLLLNACAITESPVTLTLESAAQWEVADGLGNPIQIDPQWWQAFGSSQLPTLIQEALKNNSDLLVAAERVYQQELQVGIAGAGLLPGVGLSAGSNLRRTDAPDMRAQTAESSSASLSVSYEVDIWGKVAASVRGAQAQLEVSQFDEEALRLSIVAAVASQYITLLGTQERLQLAQRNLELAQRVLDIVEARYRNGSVSELDLNRQQTAVLSQRSAIVELETRVKQQRWALDLLLGQSPQTLREVDEAFAEIQVPEVAAGIPSELLLRRPDLASAEARMLAANADIVQARAALLPAIQLTGSAGLASNALLSLTQPTSSLLIGAALSQLIFDGGRQRTQVELLESQRRQLMDTYRNLWLTALKEVEDTLSDLDQTRRQLLLQEQIEQRSARALELAEIRYREGAEELSTVLDAQRTLFQARDQLIQLQLNQMVATVNLYKVLGGGWQRGS